MIKITITGSIASGKSLVEEIFREKGANTLDTDKVTHELLEKNKEVISKVCELCKPVEVLNKTGSIDRKKVGEVVFSNKEKLKQLEAIIHPEVKKVVEEFFKSNQDMAVVSVPLLYEAGMESMFDYVILVTADENIRLQRLVKTRNLTEETALIRIKSQNFGQEKLKKANFVIENNASIERLRSEIENIIEKIKR